MNWTWFLIDVAILVIAIVLSYATGYADAKRVFGTAYKDGRRDELEWWTGVETEISEAQQEMWKEGLRR